MLKLISIDGGYNGDKVATIFADTKAEVPATGAETKQALGDFPEFNTLGAGSCIYTASAEVAFLKSDDQWNWVE